MIARSEIIGQKPAAGTPTEEPDAVWGALAIGRIVGLSASQVRYLHKRGVFGKAVKKVSHKTYLGSRKLLRQLALD